MWKIQIRKGDDFEDWGQKLKEEICAKAKSPKYSKPSIHFIPTIYPSFINPIS